MRKGPSGCLPRALLGGFGKVTLTKTAFFLRSEIATDATMVDALTLSAFENQPHSRQTEGAIIRRLREAGALSLSLVAQAGTPPSPGPLVGQVTFSPISILGDAPNWYGLGPLSVVPDWQGRGVGAQLVLQGLRTLRQRGAAGCVVLGEPAYYGRFGFHSTPALTLPDAPSGCFLVRPFARIVPMGVVSLHPAFDLANPADWSFP